MYFESGADFGVKEPVRNEAEEKKGKKSFRRGKSLLSGAAQKKLKFAPSWKRKEKKEASMAPEYR